jgi:hypothetical protein
MAVTGPLGLKGDLARDAIIRTCASGLPARELFAQVGAKLRPLVPYASAGWLSTDPATMLYTDKASFGKVGVASRPELTAKLFAEHFLPAIDA